MRRRCKPPKSQRERVYTLKESDINIIANKAFQQGYEKGKSERLDEEVAILLSLPMVTLREEFGFGHSRLNRFYENLLSLYEKFSHDPKDIEELILNLYKETGIKVFLERS